MLDPAAIVRRNCAGEYRGRKDVAAIRMGAVCIVPTSLRSLSVLRAVPVVLLLALSLTACSKSSKPADAKGTATPASAAATPANASATPAPPEAAPTAAKPGADDPPPSSAFVKPVPAELPSVVAKVNGESVTKQDVQKALTGLEQQNGGPVPPTERDRIVRALVEQMVGFKLLLQESQARKVAVTDQEIDARMTAIRQQFPTEDAFKNALSQQKVTLDQVRTEQRQQLMINRLLENEVGPKTAVAPADIEKAYKEHPEAFQQGPQVRASHILIKVPENADASVKAEALAKATKVLKSARAGKDFAALAKEFSEDPGSAAQGGDLGFFSANQMVPQFSDAAFKMKPGSISDVVETQFGYHIIKVVEKKPGRTVKLEEVRPQIEQQLVQMNRQREVQAFVQSLRQKGKIEIFI
jgi:peptidyl-prolyl cis-trans isomerase C